MTTKKPEKKAAKDKPPTDIIVAGCPSSSISSGSGDTDNPCRDNGQEKLAKNEDESSVA